MAALKAIAKPAMVAECGPCGRWVRKGGQMQAKTGKGAQMQVPFEKDARACGRLERKGKAGHKLRRRDEVSGPVQSLLVGV